MKRFVLSIFLMLLLVSKVQSQTYIGTDFRFSFLANIAAPLNGLPNFDISIEAIENATITVAYGTPADAYYLSETITINAGESDVVSFNQVFLNQNTTGVIENRSFHVTATGNIRVYAFHFRAFFSDATPVLPTVSLKSDYMVLTKIDPDMIAPALYSVVATEDNTTVNFLNTGSSSNGPAGVPFSLTLNAGEVITIASVDGLSGSTISSDPDKPIAVFAGNRQAKVSANCNADNHLYEQLPPTEYWGTIHPVIPTASVETVLVRIIALEDNTEVYAGCNLITTLNSGEVYEGLTAFTVIMRSTAPVLIAVFTRGFECASIGTGDPSMRFLQPLDKVNLGFKLETNSGFQQNLPGAAQLNFLILAMPTDQTDQIQINGNPVLGWAPFATLPAISHVSVEVTDISVVALDVQSTAPFWSEYVSLTGADAITMSMGATTSLQLPDDLPIVNLGPDQTICEGQTIVLDPGLDLVGIWQDGSEQETYNVDEPGTYSVQIAGGCNNGYDEITITPGENVVIDLPEIYNLCEGNEIEIGVENNTTIDYEWNTGAQTSHITVASAGVYSLTASINGFCESTQATNVVLQPLPDLNIEGPLEICAGNESLLTASGDEGDFLWADGTIGSTLSISQPGNYTVSLTNILGCQNTENIVVALKDGPLIEIDGPESICENENATLIAIGDSGDLNWSNASSGSTLVIESPGTYSVTLTSADGCTSTASIRVFLLSAPVILVADAEFCAEQSVAVTAISSNASLSWPGFSDNATIEVSEEGIYEVRAVNACGTTNRDVGFTEKDCSCEAYVPNAFTPNGDGLNDLFKPEIGCKAESYLIKIYNRWGLLVYESTSVSESWNGNSLYNSDYYASDGVYFYLIEYVNPLLPLKQTLQINGSVMLLR